MAEDPLPRPNREEGEEVDYSSTPSYGDGDEEDEERDDDDDW